jgi:Meiotically up-regulated protein Msb1/Mug8 domain
LLTSTITGHHEREQDYGYLSYQHHVVLGLDEVNRLVRTVTDELGTRGLTTPFLFSSLAIDINSARVRRLIQAFLRTCVSFPAPDAEYTWREEARFAAPPELAMCLRWGLARVLRVSGGSAVRGLISWDMYVEWSEAELRKRFSRHSLLPTILIPFYSPRLSSDLF